MANKSTDFARSILLSENSIKKRVRELANQISKDYKNKNPLFIGVLKGSFIFLADLLRELDPGLGAEVDFMAVSSYGEGTESSRQPKIEKDIGMPITGRNVIVVEDMVDTGYSFKTLLAILGSRKPASLKTCVLLSKDGRREVSVPIDYLGFTIDNYWVEGYGLDTNEKYRGLKNIIYRKTVK